MYSSVEAIAAYNRRTDRQTYLLQGIFNRLTGGICASPVEENAPSVFQTCPPKILLFLRSSFYHFFQAPYFQTTAYLEENGRDPSIATTFTWCSRDIRLIHPTRERALSPVNNTCSSFTVYSHQISGKLLTNSVTLAENIILSLL